MFTLVFWRNVAERAVKSAAQGAALVLTGSAADLYAVDVKLVLGGAGFAALYSVVTSLGTEVLPVGNPGTASATKAVEPTCP